MNSKTYEIITVPHPALKARAQEVARVDDAIRAQMDGMLRAMYDAPGIGLAANQVNILNRVVVMDLNRRAGDEEGEAPPAALPASTTLGPFFMANPEIIYESDERSVMEEGCLSIPRQVADVERPAIVRVRYWDYHGKEAELEASGLLSHCVQHEIDHLNGVLFVDHLSMLKRNMVMRRYEKIRKQNLL